MARTRAAGSARNEERFSTVPGLPVGRSSFDRSYSYKTTINSGFLYPIHVDEILPGDTVNLQCAFFARMSTPLKPFMDGIWLDSQWFFIPLRLVWTNFVRMMGERPDPDDHNDYTVPQMVPPSGGHVTGSLSDYLTLPTDITNMTHTSLYHRAYALVYREWYRDENLQDAPIVDLDDGPDTANDYPLFRRGKRKDYFSGALLTAQKGDPVSLPLGATAPVISTGDGIPIFDTDFPSTVPSAFQTDTGTGQKSVNFQVQSGESGNHNFLWNDTKLVADLSAATSATINEMRIAITLQHVLERDARGGTRYVESVYATFGVRIPDLRLFRPELLATTSTAVQVNPVSQTTYISAASRTGQQGAFATLQSVSRGFSKSFDEHGIIMGIASIRAELSYQQGMNRMFSRKTRADYFDPMYQNLGEQAVLSQEIYVDGTGDPDANTGDFEVWGYQPRFEEYRHRTSCITGEFRSQYATPLDVWHLGLDFGSRPVLNAAFIEENPPIERVISLTTEPQFFLDCFYKIKHVRPMARFSTPGLARF